MGKFAAPELIVRPFVVVNSTPKYREPTPPAEDTPDAYIKWGQAAAFGTDDFREDAQNVGFKVSDPGVDERVRNSYNEEGRATKDYRVENPSDPEQYVIVRETVGLAFSGPRGEQFRFHLKGRQGPGIEEGEGQTPPAPPPLDEIGA